MSWACLSWDLPYSYRGQRKRPQSLQVLCRFHSVDAWRYSPYAVQVARCATVPLLVRLIEFVYLTYSIIYNRPIYIICHVSLYTPFSSLSNFPSLTSSCSSLLILLCGLFGFSANASFVVKVPKSIIRL